MHVLDQRDVHTYIVVHASGNQYCTEADGVELVIQTMIVLDFLAGSVPSALFLLLGSWAILYLYLRYKHTYWKRRGVPSIPGHWLFGNVEDAVLMRSASSYVFGDLYRQASESDILGVYVFHKPVLILRNPELIKHVLIKDFNIFSNRYFTAESIHDKIGSSNLFTIKNPKWKYLRTKITPVFTSGKMKKLFHLIVESAESMQKYMEDQFSDGSKTKTIVVKDVALKYTTDIISSVAFGIQVNSFDSSKNDFFRKAQEGLKLTLKRSIQFSLMFFFPIMSPYFGAQMLGSSTNYFRKVFWESVDIREATKAKRGDLIDSLIDLKNEKQDNEDFKFEGDVLVSQSGIFFVAGRESSVTTITFTLCELAKHPDIQKRVRDEIIETLQTQGMTYEAVQSMKYLHQVISEVLRLYPAAPFIDRVASEDYKIPGTDIVIEKGTPVYVPLCGIHRDPKYHPDPLRFNPDRFSDENKDKITQCTYMPFGEGPRICIGLRLGLLQSAMGVITILKDYEVSLDPTYTCGIEIRNVFISPPDGFKLIFTKL